MSDTGAWMASHGGRGAGTDMGTDMGADMGRDRSGGVDPGVEPSPACGPGAWALLALDHGRWRRISIGARLSVGSGPMADLKIDRSGVASTHCRLRVAGGALYASQIADGQPATLAGRPLDGRGRRVRSGQTIRVGGVPLVALRQRPDGRRRWLQVGELGSGAPAMWEAIAELCLAAPSPWPLLLTGETGTGKELAARVAHNLFDGGAGPLVTVNCAALNAGTLQAELFGACRGAYTGSVGERIGAFERADGGTLLLDEIGELPLEAQAALLRVLEGGEIQVVGGEVRSVQVRIVAATNRSLEQEVSVGRFRLDLLHRLGVARVHLPALRARGRDALFLLERFCGGVPLPEGAAGLLDSRPWRGNVRELKNAARRLNLITADAPPTLEDLTRALGGRPAGDRRRGAGAPHRRGGAPTRSKSPADAERIARVAELLARHGTTTEAWRESGLRRTTFFRLLRKLRAGETARPEEVPAAGQGGLEGSASGSIGPRGACLALCTP